MASSKDSSEQVKNSSVGNEDRKKQNTGSITTSTNHTDESGFTHPQHEKNAGKKSEPDSASGVTTATNRTDDSGFTKPGEDMSKSNKSSI